MAAGRRAPHADAAGVDAVVRRVGTQPAHGRLAILDLRRVFRLRTEPIADARHRVASRRHRAGRVLVVGTLFPTAPVNPHDERRRRVHVVRHRGQEEVETLVRVPVVDVREIVEITRGQLFLRGRRGIGGRWLGEQTAHDATGGGQLKKRSRQGGEGSGHGRYIAGGQTSGFSRRKQPFPPSRSPNASQGSNPLQNTYKKSLCWHGFRFEKACFRSECQA